MKTGGSGILLQLSNSSSMLYSFEANELKDS